MKTMSTTNENAISQLAADQLRYLREAIEFAPRQPRQPVAAGLVGWWCGEGWYLCASCAGRIMDRGCSLPSHPQQPEPVWSDQPERKALCCLCEDRPILPVSRR